jgi:hypothetical protein
MPDVWYHVIINTRCSWLHGDARGFRSRDHRIHSSGDYASPPPSDEHAGLRKFHQARSGAAVTLPTDVRPKIMRAYVAKMRALNHPVDVVSVSGQHLHSLARLPSDRAVAKREIGKAKQAASHAVRETMPGSVWSEGCALRPVLDERHLENVYEYIRFRQEPGTLVWSTCPKDDWMFGSGASPIVFP